MLTLRYAPSLEIDYDADVEAERYTSAMNKITTSDVLSVVDDLIASEIDERQHPAYSLVQYYLGAKGTDTGQVPHSVGLAGVALDRLVRRAIDTLIDQYLADDCQWED